MVGSWLNKDHSFLNDINTLKTMVSKESAFKIKSIKSALARQLVGHFIKDKDVGVSLQPIIF